MTDIDRESLRLALAFKNNINSKARHFQLTEGAKQTWTKLYKYIHEDIKLLKFASSQTGTTSDCYSMYAVAKMGCCNLETMSMFLRNIQRRNPDLAIADTHVDDDSDFRKRVNSLFKNGFFFKLGYSIDVVDSSGRVVEDNIRLYTIDKSSQSFMNQKLCKRVVINDWIQAKPWNELIGWAAANYTGVYATSGDAFVEYKDGIFRSRSLGVVNLPLEFKNKVAGKDYYVASVPFFAYWNKELQTNDEFVKHTISKISVIREYLSFREAQGKEARVIVTCEDSDDVDNFAKWCMQTEILLEHMDKIYVTGEGIHRAGTPLEASFARLKIRGDSYTLSVERPDFI